MGTQAALSPQHPEAQGAFGAVVGGFDAVIEKHPQVVDFPYDLSGETTRIGFIVFPQGQGEKKERIEIRPLFRVGRFFGKMDQLPQRGSDNLPNLLKSDFFLSARASALRIRWARQVWRLIHFV